MSIEQLEYARPGDPIRAEAWNAMVDAVRKTPDNSFNVGSKKRKLLLKQVCLWSEWTKEEGQPWKAKAKLVVDEETGTLGDEIDVFAPTDSERPQGVARSSRFHVVRRKGRWIKFDLNPSAGYIAGEGIQFDSTGTSTSVSNTGVLCARLEDDNVDSRVIRGELLFDKDYFALKQRETDSVGTNSTTAENKRCYCVSLKDGVLPSPSLSASVSGNALTITLEL